MWIEYSENSRHGTPPVLVPIEERIRRTGYTSAYAYPDSTADWIRENYSERYKTKGSIVGVTAARLPVYTDRLLVDFDTNPVPDAKKLTKDLRNLGVAYSVWETGGRSIHVHIHCVPKEDWRVPASQKDWIDSWARTRDTKVDLSIYHAAALFRLPGTPHEKTGKRKIMLDNYAGSVLDYDIVERRFVGAAPENKDEAERMLWRLLLTRLPSGGRQFHVWKIATNARRLGWTQKKIEEHVAWWNTTIPEPLTTRQLEDKLWKSLR